jgi:hypothetical protein
MIGVEGGTKDLVSTVHPRRVNPERAYSMPFALSGLWIGVIVVAGIAVAAAVLLSGLRIGEKVESVGAFYRAVDDARPSELRVWITPARLEPSGNLLRDLRRALGSPNDRFELAAFMDTRRPVSVVVTPDDRPAKRPFAHLFPGGYPEELVEFLTLIEWRQRLQQRWPKALVEVHSISDEDEWWREQLEHAERWILEQQEGSTDEPR